MLNLEADPPSPQLGPLRAAKEHLENTPITLTAYEHFKNN